MLLATTLFGTGAAPPLYRCAIDGDVHAERCCDEGEGADACCQPVASEHDDDATQVPASPAWEAPGPVTLPEAGWVIEAAWAPVAATNPAAPARGPPRGTGPPLYLRDCSLLI